LGHLLRPLEKRGLVRLDVSAKDGRSRVIALTKAGTCLLKKARPLWAKAERRFERTFGTEIALRLRIALKQVATANFDQAGAISNAGMVDSTPL
jgi:DNA-binding MarR family transcriptional regulator